MGLNEELNNAAEKAEQVKGKVQEILDSTEVDEKVVETARKVVDAVDVDCGRLDYISSAGLRVLLIMHKACKGGVSLHGENEVVSEILSQTGFDSIFH